MVETEFTPLASLLGGCLIGVAAVVLMAGTGRIAGVSGIFSRLLPPFEVSGAGQRIAFVGGLIAAPFGFAMVTGAAPQQTVSTNAALLVVAGLLVGFGSVFGSGCTSGHGVCGVARWSVRSLVATVAFTGIGMVVVFVARHVLGGL